MPLLARISATIIALAGVASIPSAHAQDAQPEAVSRLLDCAALTSGADRLDCQDAALAEFSAALEQGELRVVDRRTQAVEQERRFGLPSASALLPSLNSGAEQTASALAEDADVVVRRDEAGRIQELSGLPVAQVTTRRDGRLIVTLENGQVWLQTEGRRLREPREGETVRAVLDRGALGSFFMELDYVNARFRARRVDERG